MFIIICIIANLKKRKNMEQQKVAAIWQYNSEEEYRLAEYIIGLEKAALNKWFKGDTSGYEQLWSKHSFFLF